MLLPVIKQNGHKPGLKKEWFRRKGPAFQKLADLF